VEEAIEAKEEEQEIEHTANVFVVDASHMLTGVVSLDKLILAGPEVKIKTIATPDPIRVNTDIDQEEVAKLFQRYDLVSAARRGHGGSSSEGSPRRVVGVIGEIFEDFQDGRFEPRRGPRPASAPYG
jgi:hypothetical protein